MAFSHVQMQDFNSSCLKTKRHWNSFTSPYFLNPEEVIDRLRASGAFKPPPSDQAKGGQHSEQSQPTKITSVSRKYEQCSGTGAFGPEMLQGTASTPATCVFSPSSQKYFIILIFLGSKNKFKAAFSFSLLLFVLFWQQRIFYKICMNLLLTFLPGVGAHNFFPINTGI